MNSKTSIIHSVTPILEGHTGHGVTLGNGFKNIHSTKTDIGNKIFHSGFVCTQNNFTLSYNNKCILLFNILYS